MSMNTGKGKKKEGYFLFAAFRMEVLADQIPGLFAMDLEANGKFFEAHRLSSV